MTVLIAKDAVREPLYAIVPVFNPWRWKTRYKHTDRAIKHFMDAGAVVILVEATFNRREAVYADSGLHNSPANCGVLGTDHEFRHQYVQFNTKDELWIKENLINNGAARIPNAKWEQICWLDSDVMFARPNWVGECIHKLQHYAFLQMFSHARDLGPDYEVLPQDYPHADGRGFVDAFYSGALDRKEDALKEEGNDEDGKKPDHHHHKPPHHHHHHDYAEYAPYQPRVFPGLAWAATRQSFDAVGGLVDFAVWGGGDHHMAWALIERPDKMMRNDLHRNYKKLCMQWYYRCHTHIRRNVGCMKGTILHNWHGRKTERGYNAKHALLAKIGFDPLRHLKRDTHNIWQLHDDRSTAFVQLRDMLRKIAHERNEDSDDTRLDLWSQGH